MMWTATEAGDKVGMIEKTVSFEKTSYKQHDVDRYRGQGHRI